MKLKGVLLGMVLGKSWRGIVKGGYDQDAFYTSMKISRNKQKMKTKKSRPLKKRTWEYGPVIMTIL